MEVLANLDSIFLGGQAKELEKISDTFISTQVKHTYCEGGELLVSSCEFGDGRHHRVQQP